MLSILYDDYDVFPYKYIFTLYYPLPVKLHGYMLKILISENKAPLYSGLDAQPLLPFTHLCNIHHRPLFLG